MIMAATTRTFTDDDRLHRKRQAARIRQQRCRARKRAMAAAQLAVSKGQHAARVIVDDKTVKYTRSKPLPMMSSIASSHPSTSSTTTSSKPTNQTKMAQMQAYNRPHRMPFPHLPESNHPTTVDGVKMSKRAAAHAALLDEHNRKFFAQVAAERKNEKKEEHGKGKEDSHIQSSHVVVKNNAQSGMHRSANSPTTKSHSPVHPYYRHAPYPYYPYHPAYGPRPHGKYMAPPPPPPHPTYSSSPPMYRAYDGRYHPIPPHAMPQHHHFSSMEPADTTSSSSVATSTTRTSSLITVVSNSVSDDERSTPSPELSPATRSYEEETSSSSSSLKSMEQEAIAAMLTLSNASMDEDYPPPRMVPPQQPILLSQ